MTNEEYINQIVEIGNTLQIQPNSPKGQTLKKCIELLSAVSERENGMTNGEVLTTLFPNENKDKLMWFYGTDWWNAPYKKRGEE